MKKLILVVLSFLLLASVVFAVDINLKATWTPNTEPDMAKYRLYRIDGGSRVLIAEIPHPPALPYSFKIDIPAGTEGTAIFVLTAVDTSGNESEDSNQAPFAFDLKAPAAPKVFSITR
jgi:hypothetical protein